MNGMNWQAQQAFECGHEHVEQLKREAGVERNMPGEGLRGSGRILFAALGQLVRGAVLGVRGGRGAAAGPDVPFEGVKS